MVRHPKVQFAHASKHYLTVPREARLVRVEVIVAREVGSAARKSFRHHPKCEIL